MSSNNDNKHTELDQLRNDVLMCKFLWGHKMDSNPSPRVHEELAYYARTILCLRCERCGRERYDYYDVNNNLMAKRWRNPIGYPKTRRLYSDELRTEFMSRSALLRRYTKPGGELKKAAAKRTKKRS